MLDYWFVRLVWSSFLNHSDYCSSVSHEFVIFLFTTHNLRRGTSVAKYVFLCVALLKWEMLTHPGALTLSF